MPQAVLQINGLAANLTFLGDAMEKLGVKWDVARVGDYKNAPDALTRNEMSPEQRETVNAYLDDEVAQLEQTIAAARGLPLEQYRTITFYPPS